MFPCAPATIDEALKMGDHLRYRIKGAAKNSIVYEEQTVELRDFDRTESRYAAQHRRVHECAGVRAYARRLTLCYECRVMRTSRAAK